MLSSKDINFVGYTYKNFEIVNDYQLPGMGMSSSLNYLLSGLRKKKRIILAWQADLAKKKHILPIKPMIF